MGFVLLAASDLPDIRGRFVCDSNADQGQDPQENDGICPYMFKPNKNDSNNEQLSYSDDDSTSTGEDLYSSDDSFEVINAWRRTDLW